MENVKWSKQSNLIVQGVEYILSVQATDDQLLIELQSKFDSQLWKNLFTSTYIEEITSKTGSHKKFGIFVQMLISAMSQKSEQATLEILTYQDLENLKSQKMQQSGQSFKSSTSSQTSQSAQLKNNKRYIILTYASEFEKVHYPLPLTYDDNIDTDKLKITIQRLKDELNDVKRGNLIDETHQGLDTSIIKRSQDPLRNENELLKAKIKRLEENQTQKIGAVEVDNMIKEKKELTQELEVLKIQTQKEIARLTAEITNRDKELVMKISETTAFKQELTKLIGRDEMDIRIKQYLVAMDQEEESQLQQVKKQMTKLEKELEKANIEIDILKKQDTKSKQRIKQLEVELESSMKKFSTKQVTNRLYSPVSQGSKKSNYSAPNRRNSPANSAKSFNSRNSSNGSNTGSLRSNVSNKNPIIQKKPVSGQVVTQRNPQVNNNRNMVNNKVLSATVKPQVSNYRSNPVSQSPINKTMPNPRVQQITKPNPTQRLPNQSPIRQQNYVAPNQNRNPQQQQIQQRFTNNQRSAPKYVPQNQNNTQQRLSENLYLKAVGPQQKQSELDNKINNLKNMLQKAQR